FRTHATRDDEGGHLLVGEPGPERMAEGCGAIVLDEEVRKPGQGVRREERGESEPGAPQQDRGEKQTPSQHGRGEMEGAGERLAMGKNVVGPEVGEGGGGVFWLHGNDSTPRAAKHSPVTRLTGT